MSSLNSYICCAETIYSDAWAGSRGGASESRVDQAVFIMIEGMSLKSRIMSAWKAATEEDAESDQRSILKIFCFTFFHKKVFSAELRAKINWDAPGLYSQIIV